MLNYRHSFYIDNHTDALKRIVQSLITESLKEKGKPFLYLDTHTRAGHYRLGSKHAEHTGKYLEDIVRIWQQDDLPAELEVHINVVKHFNRSGQLRYYPGLLLIVRQLLREQDSLQPTELHPSDYPLPCSEFQKDSRAHAEKADGFQQLRVKLPPVPRCSSVLIDLPYETKTDYQAVVSEIAEGYKRFTTGTYALWYSVVLRQQIKYMIHDLEATGIRRTPQIEPAVLPDSDRRGITASGITVINPPWKLEQQMNSVLPWLYSKLVLVGTEHTTVSWIVPE